MRLTDARRSLVALVMMGVAVGGAPGARAQAQEQLVDPYAGIIDRAAILDPADLDAVASVQRLLEDATGAALVVVIMPSTGETPFEAFEQQIIDSERVFFGSSASQAMLLVDIEGQRKTELDFFSGNTGHFALDASVGLSGRLPASRFDCVRSNAIAPQLADRDWDGPVLVTAIRSAADGISRAIAGLPWIDPMALLGSWSAPSESDAKHIQFEPDGSYASEELLEPPSGGKLFTSEKGTFALSDCTLVLTPTSRSTNGEDVGVASGATAVRVRLEPGDEGPGSGFLYLGDDVYMQQS